MSDNLPSVTPTPFETLFATAYIESNNDACRAYKAACGSSFMGSDRDAKMMGEAMLRQPRVQMLLKGMRKEIESIAEDVCGVSRQWVMEQLKDTYATAKGEGKYAPAITCLQLLGKEIGMFVDRKEETRRLDLSSLSREDIVQMLRQLQAIPASYNDILEISDISQIPTVELPKEQ